MELSVRLPLLGTLLDLEVTGPRLERLLAWTGRGASLRVSSAMLIDCKPGDRALIAYMIERPSDAACSRVFGKHFRNAIQARRVHEIQQSLWSTVFRRTALVGVPRPVGWLPEFSLVLYVAEEGRYLDDVVLDGRADEPLRLAAEWLARLHASELALERTFDLDNEVANVQAWADVVGATYPEEADTAARISRIVRERASLVRFAPHAPIHKDLHYRHVIVGSRLTVVDFDEMRVGDPSFDLAHFCTHLHVLCRRAGRPSSYADLLERVFLGEYASRRKWQLDERFTYFCAYTSLKIARQLCELRGVRPRPTGEAQRAEVRAILDHGRSLSDSLL